MIVIYLHGFASSPESSKATFLAERFVAHRIRFVCPDFNEPDFSTLTVSRMLQQLEKRVTTLPAGEVALIGSSLGGFVAVEAAARQVSAARHPITRVVLLAPAVELEWDRWPELGPGGVDGWKSSGDVDVFHYAQNETAKLKYTFYEDALKYRPALRTLGLPMLIFQGRRDESVSPESVERFARNQKHATLHLLDDTHQLKNSLDVIWEETQTFLALPKA